MIIDSTLYRGVHAVWKIRVSPMGYLRKEREQPGITGDESFFRFWTPSGSQQEYLFYEPRVVLLVQEYKRHETRISIPLSVMYLFRDALQVMINRSKTEGLYTTPDGQLHMDKSISYENHLIIPLPRDSSVRFQHSLVVEGFGEDSRYVKGITIQTETAAAGCGINLAEARNILEILNHVDISTYTTILTLLETIHTMDRKLDTMMELQHRILRLLGQESKNVKVIDDEDEEESDPKEGEVALYE